MIAALKRVAKAHWPPLRLRVVLFATLLFATVLFMAMLPGVVAQMMVLDGGKLLVGVVLVLGAMVVLAGLLSRGIARPIDALSRASEGVALGRVEIPETPVTAVIEIRALYDNFRAMADRIERRSRYLRDFAAAVAHEFKTPLAGITGALELLDEHGAEMSEAERRRFIGNAAADADRLSRLVQRLLDLARADMTTIGADSRADVALVAAQLAATTAGPPVVAVSAADALPYARITPEVLATILATLIDNSRLAGASSVTIDARLAGDDIAIAVTDDGPGVPAADRERIFEPFFTGRRESGGAGLGLAIARSLLSASGGAIDCVAAPKGAHFALRLPVIGG